MKKRKNPWIKRRANQKFNEILLKIEENIKVSEKLKEHEDVISDIKKHTNNIDDLTKKYINIANSIKVEESIIQDLSIASLKDLRDVELTGKVNKTQYRDVLKAGDLRRQALFALEHKDELLAKSRASYIDFLEAKIEALIDILDKDSENNNES